MTEEKGNSEDKLLFCSFCGKNQNEVRKLIAGPSVYICNECVDLCNDIIQEEINESVESEEEAKVVCDGFDNVYKGVNKFSYQLSAPIKRKDRNYVITHTGRKLPVDADRSYAALNYCIQSTARDVLGKAMIKLAQAGFWKYALLPIHDEVLFSFPEAEAEELCKEAGCKMEMILKAKAHGGHPQAEVMALAEEDQDLQILMKL